MDYRLHLVVELNTWAPLGETPGSRAKLEAFLEDRPGITLTLVTRGFLQGALERLGAARVLPHQIVAEAGTAIFHREAGPSWREDLDYQVWVDSHWDSRALEALLGSGLPRGLSAVLGPTPRHGVFEIEPDLDPDLVRQALTLNATSAGLAAVVVANGPFLEMVPAGVDRGTAVANLRDGAPPKGPLMVCGSSDLNLNLFQTAEFPVLMADSALDFLTPGIPRERIYRTAAAGAAGVMEALIRFEFDRLYAGKEE